MIRVKYKKPFCFGPIRTPNKPMDTRPVKLIVMIFLYLLYINIIENVLNFQKFILG